MRVSQIVQLDLNAKLGMIVTHNAMVGTVAEGLQASNLGITPGSTILSIGGLPIKNFEDMQRVMLACKARGDNVVPVSFDPTSAGVKANVEVLEAIEKEQHEKSAARQIAAPFEPFPSETKADAMGLGAVCGGRYEESAARQASVRQQTISNKHIISTYDTCLQRHFNRSRRQTRQTRSLTMISM